MITEHLNTFRHSSQIKNLSCVLPAGKADDAPSPSLPRARSKILRLRPWTPWIWSILGFCNNRVKKSDQGGLPMITAGIDCGAKNTKTIIMKDGKILGKGMVPTGFDQEKAVEISLEKALKEAGIKRGDIQKVGGTGSGKGAIRIADNRVNDIKGISKAANYFFPNARTVADVGAEEGRAAKLDETGGPVDFAINEKCAAGAGAFIEAMARALEVTIEEMGTICLQSDKEIPVNAQCAIFAESEVVGLIHSKTAKTDISKAIHDAMASRIVSMIRMG